MIITFTKAPKKKKKNLGIHLNSCKSHNKKPKNEQWLFHKIRACKMCDYNHTKPGREKIDMNHSNTIREIV